MLGTCRNMFFIHSFKTSDLIGNVQNKFIIVEAELIQDIPIAKLSK